MAADVSADNYFAIIPEWILDSGISGNAVKLYALLRRYADNSSGEAHPSRRILAQRMGFSRTASVDPLIAELVSVNAVEVFERWAESGDRDSNGYRLLSARPDGVVRETAPQVVRESVQGVVRETVHKLEPLELEPKEPERKAARGTRIPADFAVSPEMRQWARDNTPLVDVDKRLPEFVDYWAAVPGEKGRKLDWVKTWRNGMRRQQEFAERDGVKRGLSEPRVLSVEELEARRREVERAG